MAIIDTSKYDIVPVENLVVPEWRWKRKDIGVRTRVAISLGRFGQIKTIVVRKKGDNYEVLDGAEVFYAAKSTGIKELFCYVFPEISDDEAKMIAMALDLNRIDCNMIDLSKAIKDIKAPNSSICSITPFSEEDVADIRRLLDFDWNVFNKEEDPTPLLF